MNRIKKYIAVLLLSIMTITNVLPAQAAHEARVIKVGYPIQEGLTEKSQDGEYIGYTVDYLKEIQKYTGWKYEFVEVEGTLDEQLTQLLEMLQRGEIDILGAMLHTEAVAELFDYPGYGYGMAYTTLEVAEDNTKWQLDDSVNWDGIVVGIYPGLNKRYKELKKYAEVMGFTFETKEYENRQEIIDALEKGEIDATLGVDISKESKLRTIARFSPVPYYFAVSKGKQEIGRELNTALSNINRGNPYLQSTLYDKYFTSEKGFSISEESKEYVKSLGTQKVLMMDGNAPIQYEKDGEAKGVSVAYLEKLKREIGLSYEIVFAKDFEEFKQILEEQDIDLVMGIPSGSSLNEDFNLILSLPYMDSYIVRIQNKNANGSKKEELHEWNTKRILDKVNQNPGYEYDVDLYVANLYMQKQHLYTNVEVQMNATEDIQYFIGLEKKENTQLLSIINRYINSLSEKEKQSIVYQNSLISIEYSMPEFLKMYRWQLIVTVLILTVFLFVLYVRRIREKNALLDMELMQQKRLNEFSRLSDECLFEYDYQKDVMHIENNQFMYDRKHVIQHFMSVEEHLFLRDMISLREDQSHDFEMDVDGQMRWYRVLLKVLHNDEGVATFAFGRIIDVHDEKIRHQALVEKAKRDNLTKLLNRPSAQELIQSSLEHQAKGVLMIFDIDNFKRVNDHKGHPVGDGLLQRFSDALLRNFKDDVVCRLGGDEFLIFIPKNIPSDLLKEKLDQLIRKLKEEVFVDFKEEEVSVSIGTTRVSSQEDTYEKLYKRADHAMYTAKLNGKNGYYVQEDKKDMN